MPPQDPRFTPDTPIQDNRFIPDEPFTPDQLGVTVPAPTIPKPQSQPKPAQKTFSEEHPLVSRFLFGPTNKEIGLPENAPKPLGPGFVEVPGVKSAFNYLANKIDNPLGEGGYWQGMAAGELQGLGDLLASGTDPRSVFAGKEGLPGALTPEVLPPEPRQQLALPPARKPTFIGGPAGNPLGEVAPETVPPDIAARISGEAIPTRSEGLGSRFDIAKAREEQRLRDIFFTQNEQGGASRAFIPNAPIIPSPVQSGDTRLGFQPQSNANFEYPLNVTPNRLRPRTVQTVTSALTPEELKKPTSAFEPRKLEQSDVIPEEPVKNEPLKPNYYVGTPGDYELPSAVKTPKTVENAKPVEVQHPKEVVLPKAGEAKPSNDITALGANLASPHKVLLSHPETVEVAEPIVTANDNKLQWIADQMTKAAEISDGLNRQGREILSRLMDHGTGDPIFNRAIGATPDLIQRANGAKVITDAIHTQFPPNVTKAGTNVGYIQNYFTHMEKTQPWAKRLFEYYFGGARDLVTRGPLGKSSTTGTAGIYQKGLGNVTSMFIEPRTGNLRQMEWDYNKVMPAYIESAGKVIFDTPAINAAKKALANVPESKLKELAASYIKNYSGYDGEPQLHKAWAHFANDMANITARSFIDFNPGLHSLHAGQIPANIYPELGEKFTTIGVAKTIAHPVQTFTEMANLGLIRGEMKPWAFRTASERWQSAAYFFNMVESYVKAIGYNGARAMYESQGLSPTEASKQALRLTKDMTMVSDAARQPKVFTPESNFIGGEAGAKLGLQFKGIPMKIVEQYIDIAKNARQDPKKFARLVAGASSMIAATAAGAHTFHISPGSLLKVSGLGAFGTAMGTVYQDLSSGNWQKALIDTAAWATPGGQSVRIMTK